MMSVYEKACNTCSVGCTSAFALGRCRGMLLSSRDEACLWANPEVSIALVPSTESQQDVSIRVWIAAENELFPVCDRPISLPAQTNSTFKI